MKLINLLTNSFYKFFSHWLNTKNIEQNANYLQDILIISISDGLQKAKVITCSLTQLLELEEHELLKVAILELILNKIRSAQQDFQQEIKWLRIEWVSSEKHMIWKDLHQLLTHYKRNYFRSGFAFRGNTKDWCLLTEMELNSNACLYPDNNQALAKVNLDNLTKYIKSRHSSKNLPAFKDELEIILFQTEGVFFDAEDKIVEKLSNVARYKGHRDYPKLNVENLSDIITKSTLYLANQVQTNGKFIYGHFPCFGREINFYNTLRHASSIYAMIEGYEFCRRRKVDTVRLIHIKKQISLALHYLLLEIIRDYPDDISYVIEKNGEIKLGANAVAILALVKYIKVFPEEEICISYLILAERLANGIIAMQKESGQFVHVLNSNTLEVIAENRIIYYDGEAAFGLMRLYGLTKNTKWLNCVTKAFDYFISAGHEEAHDHWLSYCSNELVIYKPEKKYFEFALNNIKGYTSFIKKRITTFPTLLELSMAFHKMLLKLEDFPQYQEILYNFDVKDFYQALHARANYLVNGFFFPEMAMYFKKPDTILHGCFIRHHSFRVRIDDVEHYLSGWIAYHSLLDNQIYPKTKLTTPVIYGDQILNKLGLTKATKGSWVNNHEENNWFVSGVCIHAGSFKKGCILVARSKSAQKGFLPKVAINSYVRKGAKAILTDDPDNYMDIGVPVLHVSNVKKAVLDIGEWSRKYYQGNVIGITGSAGKTTTVAMLAHVLEVEGRVGQTTGSANLPIGIAWNMASMPQIAKNWVLEMAIGQMSHNSQLVCPDIAVITNIAPAHLEYHRTLEAVAIKKARIFDGMEYGSTAVICRDIEQYDLIEQRAIANNLKVMSYGEHIDADIQLIDYQDNTAVVQIYDTKIAINMNANGRHMVLNAMAVVAIGYLKKLDMTKVIDKLQSFVPIKGRGEISKVQYNESLAVTVYDESYNANPLSMQASIATFINLQVDTNKKVLIIGDMLELGVDSEKYHMQLAEYIEDGYFRSVILVGQFAKSLYTILIDKNIRAYHFDNVEILRKDLKSLLMNGDHMMLKASNGIKLERLLDCKSI